MSRGYTEEDLLDALRSFAAEHDGRPPTAPEADDPETGLPTAATFARRFGSWNAAIAAAGFDPRDRAAHGGGTPRRPARIRRRDRRAPDRGGSP